jgi:hypothetical protein
MIPAVRSRVDALFMVLAVSFLMGCQQPLPKETAASPSTDDLFHKKMECEKYQDKLQGSLDQNAFELESLYRVFYSPKRNSCLAARYTLYPKKNEPSSEKVYIVDILNQEEVWSAIYAVAKTYPEVQAELDEQVKLQGLE